MNSTKTNLMGKICAVLVIFALTVSDFLPVGKAMVSYAIDVVKTNNANVEFSAYFQNENEEKIKKVEDNIDKEEYLYVDVSVKNEGYFNGEITISNNNFNIKSDKLSPEVAEINGNVVKLNQINAGSTAKIKLAIEAKKDNNINESLLNAKTNVQLNGQYVNSKNVEKDKYVDIKGNDEVEIKWNSSEGSNVELEAKLLTNSVYDVNGENKRLVQMLINSKVTNNNYPVKNTEITLNVPEKVEEVKVTARSTNATNSKLEFNESNYEYNKESKSLTIKISNEDNENINWEKDVQDSFVVTYVLNKDTNIANEEITINDKIKLYDEKEITQKQNGHIEEEIDGIISNTIESNENEIYKGKIYSKEDRDYIETNKINIDYIESGDKIEIVQKEAKYLANETEKNANILYKETKINKDEFLKIFGENGYLTVKNSDNTVISNINKDTEANEEGKIVVTYPNGEKEIKIETSAPQNIGSLSIENTKTIKDAGYGKEDIEKLTGIKEETTVNKKVSGKTIVLKETETQANIALDVTKISTVADTQTITIDGTLQSNDESKDLYKNPKITVKLPKEINVKTAQYAVLYKNGLNVVSTKSDKNENGENEVSIQFEGEQEKYDVAGGTKIRLKLDVSTNKLTPSKTSQIEMTYTNENKNQTKTAKTDIGFESQYGVMIYNQIVNYNNNGDTLVTVDKETAYGELDKNIGKKNMTLNTALINNYGENISDVTLIGKIPANQDDDNYVAKLKNIQTNNDKLKIYYSNKTDAQADDESWGEYSEDAASYKIVIGEMEKEEVIKFNVPVEIPEILKYNQKGTFSSTVSSNYQGKTETNSSNIVLATKASMATESTQKVETQETQKGLTSKISAFVGNTSLSSNDKVYEGQNVRYSVTVTNNSGKDYKNVTVKASQKNGNVWDNVEKEGVNPYYGTTVKEHFYEESDSNEKNIGTLENLKNGDNFTFEYEATVYQLNDEKIDGNETYGTVSVVSEDNTLNESIETIKNTIESAELQVYINNGNSNEMSLRGGGSVKAELTINNLKNAELKNVELRVALSQYLHPDISISEQFKERITYDNETTDKDGNTIVTFKISKINANEKIKIDLNPYTDEELNGEDEIDIWMMAEITTEQNNNYVSNKLKKNVTKGGINVEISQKCSREDGSEVDSQTEKLNNGDYVRFVTTITNNDERNSNFELEYILDNKIDVKSAVIKTDSSETDILGDVNYNNIKKTKQEIQPGKTLTFEVYGTIDTLNVDKITNTMKVLGEDFAGIKSDNLSINVNKTVEPAVRPNEDSDDSDDPENPENPDDSNNGKDDSSEDQDTKYTVSGIAWIDENKDGRRAADERAKPDVEVNAINADNGEVVATTKTGSDGTYTLELVKGKYIIVFKYENEIYTTTTYQAKEANETENSDAIEREINVGGENITAGATDTLTVENNISNLDIGLITRSTFDLKLKKYVSKITVTNNSKTQTYEQKDNTTLAKAEIKSKNLEGSLVVIEYKIKVTNAGEVAGYARNIVDYMPATLNFNSSMNSDWYMSGNNLYNTSLAKTKIEPGETKELTLVLTKNMTNANTGLVNNKAEITESSNELGIKDKTNDKGSADVIISVSTGALVNYIATTIITLIVLAGLAYLVNKKYLSRKI